MKKILVILTGILMLTCASGGRKEDIYKDPQKILQIVDSLERKHKYDKAIMVLNQAISQYLYSSYGDVMEYKLAKLYYESKKWDEAIAEFTFFKNNFFFSKFLDSAYYYLAASYFKRSPRIERDQEDLNKALNVIEEFKLKKPDSPLMPEFIKLEQKIKDKLSLKMLYIVETYYNLDKPISALLYIRFLRDQYPNTIGDSTSYLFEALIKKELGDPNWKNLVQKIEGSYIPKRFKKYYKELFKPQSHG